MDPATEDDDIEDLKWRCNLLEQRLQHSERQIRALKFTLGQKFFRDQLHAEEAEADWLDS